MQARVIWLRPLEEHAGLLKITSVGRATAALSTDSVVQAQPIVAQGASLRGPGPALLAVEMVSILHNALLYQAAAGGRA